ncbi:MAG: sel1 repeat family protein [Magnetococcales bacterium]|nr:sel1 repeat family protein [Magnetococcales bacterium]
MYDTMEIKQNPGAFMAHPGWGRGWKGILNGVMRMAFLLGALALLYPRGAVASPVAATDADYLASVEQSAIQGDPEAQVNLAMMHLNGTGVPANPKLARALLEQAAARGNPLAQFQLGSLFDEGVVFGPRAREAHQWLLAVVHQGSGLEAQHPGIRVWSLLKLGRQWQEGRGVAADPERALWAYRQAALMDAPMGQFYLGRMLGERNLGPGDREEAVTWLTLALRNGYGEAGEILQHIRTGHPQERREPAGLPAPPWQAQRTSELSLGMVASVR